MYLSSAGIYNLLKLRGFDYPERNAQGVTNVCHLRAIYIVIMGKCSIQFPAESFYYENPCAK